MRRIVRRPVRTVGVAVDCLVAVGCLRRFQVRQGVPGGCGPSESGKNRPSSAGLGPLPDHRRSRHCTRSGPVPSAERATRRQDKGRFFAGDEPPYGSFFGGTAPSSPPPPSRAARTTHARQESVRMTHHDVF